MQKPISIQPIIKTLYQFQNIFHNQSILVVFNHSFRKFDRMLCLPLSLILISNLLPFGEVSEA